MYKKLLFTCGCIAFLAVAEAQSPYPFPLRDAVWSQGIIDKINFNVYSCTRTLHYGFGGDTSIGVHTYAKVYVNINNSAYFDLSAATYFGALRDDAGKVLLVPPDSIREYLMYDFSVQQGELVTVYFPCYATYFVEEIDTLTAITGEQIREFRLIDIYSGHEEAWWEGYGNRQGFNAVHDYYDCYTGLPEVRPHFGIIPLCFEKNGERYHLNSQTFPNCHCNSLPTDVNESENEEEILLYPNPTDALLTLKLSDASSGISRLVFIDIQGKTVYEIATPKATNELQIKLPLLPEGLYLLRLDFRERQSIFRKVLIQRE